MATVAPHRKTTQKKAKQAKIKKTSQKWGVVSIEACQRAVKEQSVELSIGLSVCLCLSTCLSVFLSVRLFLSLSVCRFVSRSVGLSLRLYLANLVNSLAKASISRLCVDYASKRERKNATF